MRTELPEFKYHADPMKTGVIIKQEAVCPVCKEGTSYIYIGPFFSVDEVEDICPWCICNGEAANKFSGSFQDAASVDDGYTKEQLEELIYRTPGYFGWQQEYWLRHCNDFCSFVDYVGWNEIKDIIDELSDDIEQSGYTFDEVKTHLSKEGSLRGYLFKCRDCGRYRLYIDCD